MSKTEYKELHLSDEKVMKPVDSYSRRRNRTSRATNGDDGHKDANDNIVIRKKRAVLPLQVDW